MILLVTGASHTGKTLLAQRLLEKTKIPYLCIDHLKMGLIRSGNTLLTPEDDDELTAYLWPVVREILKTAAENRQDLIIEGCYIPFDWRKDLDERYLAQIRFVCLAMTDAYIDAHGEEIRRHACDIEARLDGDAFTAEQLKADNRAYREGFAAAGETVVRIDDDYDAALRKAETLLLKEGETDGMDQVIANSADARLKGYRFLTLRERPELAEPAAAWFHGKWGVPEEAYLECMTAYLNGETENGWYLCLDGERIIGGMGVIDNDFHDRKDLAPNVCAVYTEEDCRGQGVAGRLLNLVVDDMRAKGVSPLYLVTDHTGFYERYGWEFLCMAQGDGEPEPTRMYIHR